MSMTVTGQVVIVEKINKKTGSRKTRTARVLKVLMGHAYLSNGHIIPEHFNGHVKEAKSHIFRYYN